MNLNPYHPYMIYFDAKSASDNWNGWQVRLAHNGVWIGSYQNKKSCQALIQALQADMDEDINDWGYRHEA